MVDTEEFTEIRRLAAQVARDVYGPLAEAMDRDRTPVTLEQRQQLGELGFLGIAYPEQYGGSGAPLAQALAVIEEFGKVCRPAAFQIFEANTGPAQVINHLGTEEQKQRWLPDIVAGNKTMAVGISEPDAGSAATDMRTSAKRAADGSLVLNGNKRWISNGGEADLYLVYCRLSDDPGAKGIGAVVVEKDAPGFTYGAAERLIGFRGIPSADLYFDNVSVPEENVVVPAGGFNKLFGIFAIERLGNTTMSLAIGQAALDATVQYVQEREQFGKPLIDFQSVQVILADMLLQVEAARLLRDRAAATAAHGLPNSLEVSLAKCTANEMAKKVTDLAMQLHGGNGLTEEYGIERMHRDAHGWAVAGGTPTMQRIRIATELTGRRFDQRR
ncbi:acyl-CoA dehydrogenase family protein [Nocardioides campestrisoli]|uniref:acyl-CoA dehydrogenase family protein n=1 Tax=Nocardioides campestrisoli TaxID=2736757 RepID=UPI0015E7D361|nr:acyl-CoA dehydrogenase family protein [Nocardioides campestrisoli]